MTVSRKKFGGLTVAKHPPTRNYMMSDDAIEYPLYYTGSAGLWTDIWTIIWTGFRTDKTPTVTTTISNHVPPVQCLGV